AGGGSRGVRPAARGEAGPGEGEVPPPCERRSISGRKGANAACSCPRARSIAARAAGSLGLFASPNVTACGRENIGLGPDPSCEVRGRRSEDRGETEPLAPHLTSSFCPLPTAFCSTGSSATGVSSRTPTPTVSPAGDNGGGGGG